MAIKNILIIEDDRFIGEMYIRSLHKASYDVDWATNGNNGLELATSKHYDLILLDIMLPELKGYEILKSIRSNPTDITSTTKIIVMTNFDQDDESRIAVENDADAYLIKAEITPRRLLEIISQIDNNQPINPIDNSR